MVSRKIYPSFLMNIFLNGIIEPFLKITEMHKLFIFHSLETELATTYTDVKQDFLILIVDDDEVNSMTVSSYLKVKGYRVLLAKDGKEAIALTKAHKPDLILMDIQMPVMDGLEATQQIRLDPNLVDIPIIALTALAMAGDRERFLEAGASDYLAKPVKLKNLAKMVQTLLERV
jgi:CheY-like chemotaxis protein